MKKISLIVLTTLLILFIVIFAFITPILKKKSSKQFIEKYKNIFSGVNAASESYSEGLYYKAEFSMPLDKWKEIEEKLSNYGFDEKNEDYQNLSIFVTCCSNENELNNISEVYYYGKYVSLVFSKCWSEALITVTPCNDGVSIFFIVQLKDTKIN